MIHAGDHRGGKRGWWPSNAQRQTILVAGPDAIATGLQGLLDRAWGRSMRGRSGHIPAGISADRMYRANGPFAYQTLAMTNPMGSTGSTVGSAWKVLPGTSGAQVQVAAQTDRAMDSLALLPVGIR